MIEFCALFFAYIVELHLQHSSVCEMTECCSLVFQPSRWALICCLCKERVGACIQCSVKTCKTAFHVTCGFSNNLEMKTILDESDEHDGVKLKVSLETLVWWGRCCLVG